MRRNWFPQLYDLRPTPKNAKWEISFGPNLSVILREKRSFLIFYLSFMNLNIFQFSPKTSKCNGKLK